MRRSRALVAALPGLAFLAQPAVAADLPETPPAGVLSADLGAALANEPVYAGATRRTTDLLPVIAFKYGTRLQGSLDDGLRWTAFQLPGIKLGPVLEDRQADRLRRAVAFPHMRSAIEAGGFIEIDTPVAEFEARLRRALTGYNGLSADLAADIGGQIGRRLTLGGEARLSWADDRFIRREYGPNAHGGLDLNGRYARPDYFTAGVEGDARFRLTRRLDLGASLAYDRLIGSIAAPQIHTHDICQVTTSLTVHFGPRTS